MSTIITRFQFLHIIRGGCGLGTAFGTRKQVEGKLCLALLLQCLASGLGCYVTIVCSSFSTFLLFQCPLYTPHPRNIHFASLWHISFRNPLSILLPPFSPGLESLVLWGPPRFLSSAQLLNAALWSGGPSSPSAVLSRFLLSPVYLILFPPITFQCFLNSNSYARAYRLSGMNPMRI